ncbi:MAG: HobA family DNA replication regulator [Campylobacterota bacterium]|nr:HobA family DNA replication regulator [Campylobacterota bacterium]
MQKLLRWTLETIREEESGFSWMEEYRYEWAPLVKSAVDQVLEGKTVLILTDESHEWFSKYITAQINDLKKNRPLLPFYPLSKCFPNFQEMKSTQELQLLEDMLEISHPNGYFIWYIGIGDHSCTKLVYRNENSFLWVMDEEIPDSFTFRSADTLLDIKLLQLFKLFDSTLSAALFGDLDLES